MKKKIILTLCGVILVLLAVILSGRRPFAHLEAGDIEKAVVRLAPPDVEYTLTAKEREKLAGLLREVVLYRRDDSYREYSGQAVIFTLTLSDGSEVECVAYNPFFVIDGRGYRTKYKPCEALNRFANYLRD